MKRIFKKQKPHYSEKTEGYEKLEYKSSKDELLKKIQEIKREIDEILKETP